RVCECARAAVLLFGHRVGAVVVRAVERFRRPLEDEAVQARSLAFGSRSRSFGIHDDRFAENARFDWEVAVDAQIAARRGALRFAVRTFSFQGNVFDVFRRHPRPEQDWERHRLIQLFRSRATRIDRVDAALGLTRRQRRVRRRARGPRFTARALPASQTLDALHAHQTRGPGRPFRSAPPPRPARLAARAFLAAAAGLAGLADRAAAAVQLAEDPR